MSKKNYVVMDGNTAAAHSAYAFTEVAAIYPITPSSPMAEKVDEWSAKGKKNLFGTPVDVIQMQSEAGAAGTCHGSLQAGALTTTFTSSQGLMLMIPAMYAMGGQFLPSVMHIASRVVTSNHHSIFGDHTDFMTCRTTGYAMLMSASPQEAMDLAAVAHLSAIKAKYAFMHCFDGFRTSHEMQRIEALDYEELRGLIDYEALKAFRRDALNPEHPTNRGNNVNPDVYFQCKEGANVKSAIVPGTVQHYMDEINKITAGTTSCSITTARPTPRRSWWPCAPSPRHCGRQWTTSTPADARWAWCRSICTAPSPCPISPPPSPPAASASPCWIAARRPAPWVNLCIWTWSRR